MVCKSNPSTADSAGGRTAPLLLADAMLGRLAKWLRLLGFDTLYAGRNSDHQIAALARAEGRIVLTRDREMMRRRGLGCLYINSQVLEEQLTQVIAAYGVPEQPWPAPRCPRCNQPLERVPREEVRPLVPVYVWETQSLFHRCAECDKIYWPGTHWEQIRATIARVIG